MNKRQPQRRASNPSETTPTDSRATSSELATWAFYGAILAIAAISLGHRLRLAGSPFTHRDEIIVASLTMRATHAGVYSANWDGISNLWATRPTYQFSPYSWLQMAVTSTAEALHVLGASAADHIRSARRTSAVLSALAVALAAWAADGCFRDRRVSVLAACTLAFTFVHVQDSMYGRVESLLSVSVLLCLGCAARAVASPAARRWTLLTAFTAGWTVAVKYNAAPIAVLAGWVTVVQIRNSSNRGRALARVIDVIGMGILGFIVATPEVLLNPAPLWKGLAYEWTHYRSQHIPHQAMPGDWTDSNIVYWFRYMTELGIGWVEMMLVLGYCVLAVVRRRSIDLMLAAYVAAGAAIVVWPTVRFERNLAIVTGAMAVAAAAAAVWIVDRVRASSKADAAQAKLQVAAMALALLALAAQPLLNLARFHHQVSTVHLANELSRMPFLPDAIQGLAFSEPDAASLRAPELFIQDFGDKFSAAGVARWKDVYPAERRVVIEAPWLQYGYPFSTVNTYHNGKRVHIWYRKDPFVKKQEP